MTAEQRDISEKIRAYMEAGPSPELDPGATLRCLNALRQVTLSPALVDGFKFLATGGSVKVENKDFVRGSPKLSFVCDSTAEFYKRHADVGQIIHVPQGVDHYPDIKKYLVSKGIPEDAICFMAPGEVRNGFLPGGDRGNDVKEELTHRFNNPNDKLKIIIGSDTIIEGVNLNGNTVPTYECELPWNPTAVDQLRGRSWRQGNKQGKVHMVFPLMNDSIDSFMYQKHDEKGSRLNTIWDSHEDKIDVDGIDPERIKFNLIKDPKKRADLFIKDKTADLTMKMKIAQATSDKIHSIAGEWELLNKTNIECSKEIEDMKKAIAAFNAKTDQAIIREHDLDFSTSWRNSIYSNDSGYYIHASGRNIKEARENYVKEIKNKMADSQNSIQRNKGKMETIDNTLKRYGITDAGNSAMIERNRKKYSEEGMMYKAQIAGIEGGRERYIKEAAAQIKAESQPGQAVSAAVETTTRRILLDMYDFETVENREKAKKGDPVLLLDRYINAGKRSVA
jgi:hypothetical protein